MQSSNEEKTRRPSVRAQVKGISYELLMVLIKITIIFTVFAATFTFVFGVYRNADISMDPMIKDGDLVVFYRGDKTYYDDETVVLEYEGEKQTRRVVAIAGDTVDITKKGLVINGALQNEPDIREATYRYASGVEFPLEVGSDEIFVLGDGRENATDSRVYGCVKTKDTLGKAIMIIRTRGI